MRRRRKIHPQEITRTAEYAEARGFRNILVHDYLGVDLERIWTIVHNDLLILKDAVDQMLGPNRPVRPAGQ